MLSAEMDKNSNKGFEMYNELDPVIANTTKIIANCKLDFRFHFSFKY